MTTETKGTVETLPADHPLYDFGYRFHVIPPANKVRGGGYTQTQEEADAMLRKWAS